MKKLLTFAALAAVGALAIALAVVFFFSASDGGQETFTHAPTPEYVRPEPAYWMNYKQLLAEAEVIPYIPLEERETAFKFSFNETFSVFNLAAIQVSSYDNRSQVGSVIQVSVIDLPSEDYKDLPEGATVFLTVHPSIPTVSARVAITEQYTQELKIYAATFELPNITVGNAQPVYLEIIGKDGSLIYRGLATNWLQDSKSGCLESQWRGDPQSEIDRLCAEVLDQ